MSVMIATITTATRNKALMNKNIKTNCQFGVSLCGLKPSLMSWAHAAQM